LDRLKNEYGFEAAKQLVIEKAQNASISQDGHFVEVLDRFNKDKKNSLLALKTGKEFFGALRNPEIRNNPTELANVLGAGFVYKAYENASLNKPYDPLIIQGAQALRMSPLAFVNYLASGANNPEMPPITVDSQLEALLENATPLINITRNTFPTNARKNRANLTTVNGLAGNVRTTMGGDPDVSRFRAAIISQESGGSYTVVNPDSGAIGIGQVMPENVGPWTQRYLGKSLTPEQFRFNPGAQDAVVNGRFRDMLADQRAAGYTGEEMISRAAAVWYSGNGNLWNNNKPQYYNGRRYPSIAEYTLSIWKKFQSS